MKAAIEYATYMRFLRSISYIDPYSIDWRNIPDGSILLVHFINKYLTYKIDDENESLTSCVISKEYIDQDLERIYLCQDRYDGLYPTDLKNMRHGWAFLNIFNGEDDVTDENNRPYAISLISGGDYELRIRGFFNSMDELHAYTNSIGVSCSGIIGRELRIV